MALKFDEYEATSNEAIDGETAWGIDPDSNAYSNAILAFLAREPDMGFSSKEIHEATGIARGSIRTTLRRLRERDLVRQKGPYWAVNQRGIEGYEAILESGKAVE